MINNTANKKIEEKPKENEYQTNLLKQADEYYNKMQSEIENACKDFQILFKKPFENGITNSQYESKNYNTIQNTSEILDSVSEFFSKEENKNQNIDIENTGKDNQFDTLVNSLIDKVPITIFTNPNKKEVVPLSNEMKAELNKFIRLIYKISKETGLTMVEAKAIAFRTTLEKKIYTVGQNDAMRYLGTNNTPPTLDVYTNIEIESKKKIASELTGFDINSPQVKKIAENKSFTLESINRVRFLHKDYVEKHKNMKIGLPLLMSTGVLEIGYTVEQRAIAEKISHDAIDPSKRCDSVPVSLATGGGKTTIVEQTASMLAGKSYGQNLFDFLKEISLVDATQKEQLSSSRTVDLALYNLSDGTTPEKARKILTKILLDQNIEVNWETHEIKIKKIENNAKEKDTKFVQVNVDEYYNMPIDVFNELAKLEEMLKNQNKGKFLKISGTPNLISLEQDVTSAQTPEKIKEAQEELKKHETAKKTFTDDFSQATNVNIKSLADSKNPTLLSSKMLIAKSLSGDNNECENKLIQIVLPEASKEEMQNIFTEPNNNMKHYSIEANLHNVLANKGIRRVIRKDGDNYIVYKYDTADNTFKGKKLTLEEFKDYAKETTNNFNIALQNKKENEKRIKELEEKLKDANIKEEDKKNIEKDIDNEKKALENSKIFFEIARKEILGTLTIADQQNAVGFDAECFGKVNPDLVTDQNQMNNTFKQHIYSHKIPSVQEIRQWTGRFRRHTPEEMLILSNKEQNKIPAVDFNINVGYENINRAEFLKKAEEKEKEQNILENVNYNKAKLLEYLDSQLVKTIPQDIDKQINDLKIKLKDSDAQLLQLNDEIKKHEYSIKNKISNKATNIVSENEQLKKKQDQLKAIQREKEKLEELEDIKSLAKFQTIKDAVLQGDNLASINLDFSNKNTNRKTENLLTRYQSSLNLAQESIFNSKNERLVDYTKRLEYLKICLAKSKDNKDKNQNLASTNINQNDDAFNLVKKELQNKEQEFTKEAKISLELEKNLLAVKEELNKVEKEKTEYNKEENKQKRDDEILRLTQIIEDKKQEIIDAKTTLKGQKLEKFQKEEKSLTPDKAKLETYIKEKNDEFLENKSSIKIDQLQDNIISNINDKSNNKKIILKNLKDLFNQKDFDLLLVAGINENSTIDDIKNFCNTYLGLDLPKKPLRSVDNPYKLNPGHLKKLLQDSFDKVTVAETNLKQAEDALEKEKEQQKTKEQEYNQKKEAIGIKIQECEENFNKQQSTLTHIKSEIVDLNTKYNTKKTKVEKEAGQKITEFINIDLSLKNIVYEQNENNINDTTVTDTLIGNIKNLQDTIQNLSKDNSRKFLTLKLELIETCNSLVSKYEKLLLGRLNDKEKKEENSKDSKDSKIPERKKIYEEITQLQKKMKELNGQLESPEFKIDQSEKAVQRRLDAAENEVKGYNENQHKKIINSSDDVAAKNLDNNNGKSKSDILSDETPSVLNNINSLKKGEGICNRMFYPDIPNDNFNLMLQSEYFIKDLKEKQIDVVIYQKGENNFIVHELNSKGSYSVVTLSSDELNRRDFKNKNKLVLSGKENYLLDSFDNIESIKTDKKTNVVICSSTSTTNEINTMLKGIPSYDLKLIRQKTITTDIKNQENNFENFNTLKAFKDGNLSEGAEQTKLETLLTSTLKSNTNENYNLFVRDNMEIVKTYMTYLNDQLEINSMQYNQKLLMDEIKKVAKQPIQQQDVIILLGGKVQFLQKKIDEKIQTMDTQINEINNFFEQHKDQNNKYPFFIESFNAIKNKINNEVTSIQKEYSDIPVIKELNIGHPNMNVLGNKNLDNNPSAPPPTDLVEPTSIIPPAPPTSVPAKPRTPPAPQKSTLAPLAPKPAAKAPPPPPPAPAQKVQEAAAKAPAEPTKAPKPAPAKPAKPAKEGVQEPAKPKVQEAAAKAPPPPPPAPAPAQKVPEAPKQEVQEPVTPPPAPAKPAEPEPAKLVKEEPKVQIAIQPKQKEVSDLEIGGKRLTIKTRDLPADVRGDIQTKQPVVEKILENKIIVGPLPPPPEEIKQEYQKPEDSKVPPPPAPPAPPPPTPPAEPAELEPAEPAELESAEPESKAQTAIQPEQQELSGLAIGGKTKTSKISDLPADFDDDDDFDDDFDDDPDKDKVTVHNLEDQQKELENQIERLQTISKNNIELQNLIEEAQSKKNDEDLEKEKEKLKKLKIEQDSLELILQEQKKELEKKLKEIKDPLSNLDIQNFQNLNKLILQETEKIQNFYKKQQASRVKLENFLKEKEEEERKKNTEQLDQFALSFKDLDDPDAISVTTTQQQTHTDLVSGLPVENPKVVINPINANPNGYFTQQELETRFKSRKRNIVSLSEQVNRNETRLMVYEPNLDGYEAKLIQYDQNLKGQSFVLTEQDQQIFRTFEELKNMNSNPNYTINILNVFNQDPLLSAKLEEQLRLSQQERQNYQQKLLEQSNLITNQNLMLSMFANSLNQQQQRLFLQLGIIDGSNINDLKQKLQSFNDSQHVLPHIVGNQQNYSQELIIQIKEENNRLQETIKLLKQQKQSPKLQKQIEQLEIQKNTNNEKLSNIDLNQHITTYNIQNNYGQDKQNELDLLKSRVSQLEEELLKQGRIEQSAVSSFSNQTNNPNILPNQPNAQQTTQTSTQGAGVQSIGPNSVIVDISTMTSKEINESKSPEFQAKLTDLDIKDGNIDVDNTIKYIPLKRNESRKIIMYKKNLTDEELQDAGKRNSENKLNDTEVEPIKEGFLTLVRDTLNDIKEKYENEKTPMTKEELTEILKDQVRSSFSFLDKDTHKKITDPSQFTENQREILEQAMEECTTFINQENGDIQAGLNNIILSQSYNEKLETSIKENTSNAIEVLKLNNSMDNSQTKLMEDMFIESIKAKKPITEDEIKKILPNFDDSIGILNDINYQMNVVVKDLELQHIVLKETLNNKSIKSEFSSLSSLKHSRNALESTLSRV